MTRASLPLLASDRPLLPGDLNARVVSGGLEIPHVVFDAVQEQQIKTGRQLLSYGQAFPSALTTPFGWSHEQVAAALAKLATVIGVELPRNRRMVSFGARDPADLLRR